MKFLFSEKFSFIRFLLVGGGFSLLFSVLTSIFINYLSTPPFTTILIVYISCIPCAYQCQRAFVFKQKKTRKHAFYYYAGLQILSLSTVSAITKFFISYDFVWDMALMLATAALTAIVSYILSKKIIFTASKSGAR